MVSLLWTVFLFFDLYRCFHMNGLTGIKLYLIFLFTISTVMKMEHLKTCIQYSILIRYYKTTCISIF